MLATARPLRNSVETLSNAASRDLAALWRQVDSAARAQTALRDVLPALVDRYGAAASALATEWYDDLRDKKGIGGGFRATPKIIADVGTDSLVGWALDTATDYPAFQTLILGGTQRRIKNFARLTVGDSSIADPQAQGWLRVGVGECDWCQQYLDGEIHYAEGYDFPAHDWCQCDAVPAW